jgi:hypothetical protein
LYAKLSGYQASDRLGETLVAWVLLEYVVASLAVSVIVAVVCEAFLIHT